jgi:DNA mismatch repair protein MutS2
VQLSRSAEVSLSSEIVLIGRTVDEALPLLDKYLDDAVLAALSPVRIVHGLGTGRLRAAIWKFLEGHPHVEGFGEAGEQEGGRGATLVRLRL